MSLPDWRSAAEYEELRSLDAPGFAWEFLRRNKVFAAERARLADATARSSLDAEEAGDFARRWGVRFRGRGRGHVTAAGALDGPGAPGDDLDTGHSA